MNERPHFEVNLSSIIDNPVPAFAKPNVPVEKPEPRHVPDVPDPFPEIDVTPVPLTPGIPSEPSITPREPVPQGI